MSPSISLHHRHQYYHHHFSASTSSSRSRSSPGSLTLSLRLKPLPSLRCFSKNGCSSSSFPIRAAATAISNSSLLFSAPLQKGWCSCPPRIRSGSHVSSTRTRGLRVVCSAAAVAASLHPHALQWISAISTLVLMLAKAALIQKSFLVPLFALQAPISVISWIKGEYGTWTAFLALLVRLFYFIPGELDLPFLAMLLVIVAPYQTMDLRGTQAGSIISLVIAGYLAFQHFSRAGSLQRAFDQGSIIPTLAVICILSVSCLLLF